MVGGGVSGAIVRCRRCALDLGASGVEAQDDARAARSDASGACYGACVAAFALCFAFYLYLYLDLDFDLDRDSGSDKLYFYSSSS